MALTLSPIQFKDSKLLYIAFDDTHQGSSALYSNEDGPDYGEKPISPLALIETLNTLNLTERLAAWELSASKWTYDSPGIRLPPSSHPLKAQWGP